MTVEILKYNDKSKGTGVCRSEKVQEALKALQKAHKHDQWSEELKEAAYAVLAPYHLAHGARQLQAPDIGRVDVYAGVSNRFNKKVMTQELLKSGVKASVVYQCMRKATKKTENDKLTVRFTPREKL